MKVLTGLFIGILLSLLIGCSKHEISTCDELVTGKRIEDRGAGVLPVYYVQINNDDEYKITKKYYDSYTINQCIDNQ